MLSRFGDFELDEERRELRRAGEPLTLSPRAFELLRALLARAPGAASKDDLYRHLWGDGFVVEANLSNLVSELRAVLGDNRREGRFIRTLHGFGYRFEAPVETLSPSRAGVQHAARARLLFGERLVPLHEGENVVGRGDAVDVRVDAAGVSRRHATINIVAGEATIDDLGSKNGTFVGGARVRGGVRLRDGDTLRVGPATLTFRAGSSDETTLTELAEDIPEQAPPQNSSRTPTS